MREAPDPAQVAAALDFLAGLGLADTVELDKLLRLFPEALGLRVEVMADNVQVRHAAPAVHRPSSAPGRGCTYEFVCSACPGGHLACRRVPGLAT